MIRKYYIILLICLTADFLSAQDIHFSQFYTSPLNLNPAMTGLHNCTNRAVVNYRNQWAGALGSDAYNTFSASYDVRRGIGYEDFYGIGATIWRDRAGESNYGSSQLKISGSYSKKILGSGRNKSSFLVFGADAGITQRSLTEEALRWPSQYSNGLFDGTLQSGENINNNSILYADLSAGAIWYSVINTNHSWYIGVAAHHVNQPNVSLFDNTTRLSSRYTIHGGMEYPINQQMSLVPYAVYLKQGTHWQTTAGSSLRFKMSQKRFDKESWQLGLWYRLSSNKTNESIHSDAIILSSRIDLDKLSFGFSYDATLSSLQKTGTAVGSFEFSMMYKICGNLTRGVYCPQF